MRDPLGFRIPNPLPLVESAAERIQRNLFQCTCPTYSWLLRMPVPFDLSPAMADITPNCLADALIDSTRCRARARRASAEVAGALSGVLTSEPGWAFWFAGRILRARAKRGSSPPLNDAMDFRSFRSDEPVSLTPHQSVSDCRVATTAFAPAKAGAAFPVISL